MSKRLIDIISVVGSLVTIAMVIPVTMASEENKLLYTLLYILFIFIVFVSYIILIYKSVTVRFLKYFFTKNGNYNVLLRETIYEFKSRTEMYHEKKYIIRSNRNDLQEISTRFGWSKEQILTPTTINPKHQIVKTWKSDKMTHFTILLERHFKKGEVFTSGFKIDNILDKRKESLLYLSTGIFEKTKKVRLLVKFNVKLIPKNIEIKIFKNYFDLSPMFTNKLDYDFENKEVSFEHLYPIKLSKYLITWEFEND